MECSALDNIVIMEANVKIGKTKDLSSFEQEMIISARRVGANISKTAKFVTWQLQKSSVMNLDSCSIMQMGQNTIVHKRMDSFCQMTTLQVGSGVSMV